MRPSGMSVCLDAGSLLSDGALLGRQLKLQPRLFQYVQESFYKANCCDCDNGAGMQAHHAHFPSHMPRKHHLSTLRAAHSPATLGASPTVMLWRRRSFLASPSAYGKDCVVMPLVYLL